MVYRGNSNSGYSMMLENLSRSPNKHIPRHIFYKPVKNLVTSFPKTANFMRFCSISGWICASAQRNVGEVFIIEYRYELNNELYLRNINQLGKVKTCRVSGISQEGMPVESHH